MSTQEVKIQARALRVGTVTPYGPVTAVWESNRRVGRHLEPVIVFVTDTVMGERRRMLSPSGLVTVIQP
jgi:hypothetical protein